MRLRVGARTDSGRVRDMNEDVYIARADQGLFVVCDGMGGAPAGEIASQIAAETIVEHLYAADRDAPDRGAEGRAPNGCGVLPQTSRLADAMRRSNEFIYLQAQHDPEQAEMGTTAVGAWIMQRIASVAHVGDSRAYLWYDNHLERLTCDHALGEPQHVLVRALGREPEVAVDVSEVPLKAGDYLLLCSDGLTRMLPDRAVADAIGQLREPQRICDYLIDAANRRGGDDNITVVVVEVMGNWWQRIATSWKRRPGGGHDAAAHPEV